MLKVVHECPICDFTCPYCNANAECMLDNPYDECDDYADAVDEAGEEDDAGWEDDECNGICDLCPYGDECADAHLSGPSFNEDMGFDPYLGCYTDDC